MSLDDSPVTHNAIPYVKLTSHENKSIILPVSPAKNAKLIRDLLTGIELQYVYQHACACPSEPVTFERPLDVPGEDESAENSFRCYANSYLLVPDVEEEDKEEEEFASRAPCKSIEHSDDGSCDDTTLLEIPLPCIEFDTLARIAEALIATATMKATGVTSYHDVLHDLDRNSSKDQMMAIRLLLGADFLGC